MSHRFVGRPKGYKTKARSIAVVGGLALSMLASACVDSSPPAPMARKATRMMSIGLNGMAPVGFSYQTAISRDAGVVAFGSSGNNFTGEYLSGFQIVLTDRVSGVKSIASVANGGEQSNGASYMPSLNADGSFVAFSSYGSNLDSELSDSNNGSDVFVHDVRAKKTTRVSISTSGDEADAESFSPSISDDGELVAFVSKASNLVDDDTNGSSDIFIRDTFLRTTTRVSVNTDGSQMSGWASHPSISGDGRYVAFVVSDADVTNPPSGTPDVTTRQLFIHDRETGETTRITSGQIDPDTEMAFDPSLSQDGSYMAFSAYNNNGQAPWEVGFPTIYRWSRATGLATSVLKPEWGVLNGSAEGASISSNGRFISFASFATNLMPGGNSGGHQIFVVDADRKILRRVSESINGGVSNGFSGGGRGSSAVESTLGSVYVAFESTASDLVHLSDVVPADDNNEFDVFLGEFRI